MQDIAIKSFLSDSFNEESVPQKAWVVFGGEVHRPWLRFLKPGFRHCFVLLHDGACWMSVDPMLNHMEVISYRNIPPSFDFPAWLSGRGLNVLPAKLDRTHKRPAPWRIFTCVEAVKRILGLHTRFVFTPWQLFKHLKQSSNVNLSSENITRRSLQNYDHQKFYLKGALSWEV